MIRRARTGSHRFADFLQLIPEDQKADLIDGTIYLTSPESLDHNGLVLWLGSVLGMFVFERKLGQLTINKVAYRLSDDTAPEPDLGFVCAARSHTIKSGYVDGPPDLAVEIVSPDSVTRDYEDKRRRYEADGVGEYWIIDAEEKQTTFFVRDSAGFSEVSIGDYLFHSRVVDGFSIDVRWLWQRPLPSALAIVQRLLTQAP